MSLNLKCPKCGKSISVLSTKKEFNCKNCNARLATNHFFAAIVPLLIWALTIPFIAPIVAKPICGSGAVCEYFFDVIIGLPIFIILYPVLLQVKGAGDDRE